MALSTMGIGGSVLVVAASGVVTIAAGSFAQRGEAPK
jgi:hypothetical protein